MMSPIGPDAIINEIYPQIKPSHEAGKKRNFLPWHKPRKQWIRDEQWNGEIRNLINQLKFKDGRTINYLCLPGDDLLDIRNLHELCERENAIVKYLGFNIASDPEPEVTDLHISINEVSNLPKIHKDSKVIQDNIEQIANLKSKANQYFQSYGPYDIVNLDLCTSIATPSRLKEPLNPSYYDAIVTICDAQKTSRIEPWLMFITSRAGKDDIFDEDIKKFSKCIESNTKNSDGFRQKFKDTIGTNPSSLTNDITKVMALHPTLLVKYFGLGIGKWLLNILQSGKPQWKVSMLNSYYYHVKAKGGPDMISLAFVFQPIIEPITDSVGLSNAKTHPNPLDEDEMRLAMGIISQIETLGDVDKIMEKNNRKEFHKSLKNAEKLLESARFSIKEYRKWVKGN